MLPDIGISRTLYKPYRVLAKQIYLLRQISFVSMKLGILSDLHLGYERFHEDAYAQASEALTSAAAAADALLIPGDIFDMRNPKPEVLAEAINLFRTLEEKKWEARVVSLEGEGRLFTDVPVIAIPGTHERRAHGAADPVDLLSLAGFLVDISEATAIIEKGGERVAVCGLGGIAEERFREALAQRNAQPVKGAFNIFLFHQSVFELLPFSKDFINLEELPKGFDLYIDGHIHSRVEKKVHGKPFLIPGSTVLTQLKENEQDAKGFYIFDTETGKYEFHQIKSRRFVSAKVDVDGKEPKEIKEAVRKRIDSVLRECSNPIIRIELTGRMKEGFKHMDIDVRELAKSYEGRAVIEISKGSMEEIGLQLKEGHAKGALEQPVREFGLGILVERLKKNGYALKVNPTDLFDILSADVPKEKALKKAMDEIFER